MTERYDIAELKVGDELKVRWQDGNSTNFSFIWLRDNARDDASFDARSHQRRVFTAAIDPELRPESARLDAGDVLIKWPDSESEVAYAGSFLYEFRQPRSQHALNQHKRDVQTWDNSLTAATVDFNQLIDSDKSLLEAISRLGFAIVKNCPKEQASVAVVANYLGYVRHTIFGGIWSFEANAAMDDSAYSDESLRPHTDGTFSLDPPGVQILLCLEKDGEGGESILVDGFHVAEQVRVTEPETFSDLCQIPIAGVYKGDGAVLEAEHPVFRLRDDKIHQVCFNNYDRGVMRLPDEQMQRMYEGIRVVDQRFNDPKNQWRYTLSAGEAIVFDNWRVLHGRTAYTGRRKMTGTYVNHEDLVSCFTTRLNNG